MRQLVFDAPLNPTLGSLAFPSVAFAATLNELDIRLDGAPIRPSLLHKQASTKAVGTRRRLAVTAPR